MLKPVHTSRYTLIPLCFFTLFLLVDYFDGFKRIGHHAKVATTTSLPTWLIFSVVILAINLIANVKLPQQKLLNTLFCLSLFLYKICIPPLLPYKYNLILYCAGMMMAASCAVHIVYMVFVHEKSSRGSEGHIEKEITTRDVVRVSQEPIPFSIALFIPQVLLLPVIVYFGHGPSFIEFMKTSQFILSVFLFSLVSSFGAAWRFCTDKTDIVVDGNGIFTECSIQFVGVSIDWEVVERIIFVNLFVAHIALIKTNKGRKNSCFIHFSFASNDMKNAVNELRPGLSAV